MLGGDMADLRPGCELRQEGQGQVGFCPALEGHLSWSPCSSQQSLNIPLKFLATIPSFKQPHHEQSKQQELPAHLMGPNLAPESWNIPAILSRARGGSVRRS